MGGPVVRGFFPQQKQEQEPVIVDVGGDGDCGFRSIAAGIIDNFLSYPNSYNKGILDKILERHFLFYPKHRPRECSRYHSSRHLFSMMLSHWDMPELIKTLGYTLRQIAVDEMAASPRLYPGAFVSNNEQTSPEEMRKPYRWIDETSICALSEALNIPVRVRVIEAGKALRAKPFEYSFSAFHPTTNPVVSIELERQHYRPYLVNAKKFDSNVYHSGSKTSPITTNVVNDRDLPEILELIKAEQAHIIAEFDCIHKCLTAMVESGELNKEQLLALFIDGMETSDYLQGRIKYVDEEHRAKFFSQAIDDARRGGASAPSAMSIHDAEIIGELVHAIARAISVGQMSRDAVLSKIDDEQIVIAP